VKIANNMAAMQNVNALKTVACMIMLDSLLGGT
jgi:hypothetical protein